ncbi:MAG: acyl-CoA dehydrogenase family protein [Acidimicrobiales bacterium]
MDEPGPLEQLLVAVAAMADGVLWPAAHDVDGADAIPRSHLDALADLGLFSMVVPADAGGMGLTPPEVRAVLRRLGGGCGTTAFAFAQHQGAVAALATTDNGELRRRWLGPLCDRTLAGTAFAHVRRSGPPAVRAERRAGGWRFHGEAPWATSWGLAEVFTVAAQSDDGSLVWALVPGHEQLGLAAGDPMELVVFDAAVTVRLRFDGYEVSDDAVLAVDDLDRWRRRDRRAAARPNPLAVGVGDRALAELALVEPAVADAAGAGWTEAVADAEAAALAVDGDSDDVAAIAGVRTRTVLAVQRLTTALLAASGGRGAARGHPAQLLARQALFYVVQAQNADGRAATLEAVVPRTRTPSADVVGASPDG